MSMFSVLVVMLLLACPVIWVCIELSGWFELSSLSLMSISWCVMFVGVLESVVESSWRLVGMLVLLFV